MTTKKPSAQKKAKPATKPKNALSLMRFPRPNIVSQLSGKSETLNPRLQAAIDRSEIADVLYKFARALDRMDENLLRSVLHHDATLDLGPGLFQGTGGEYVYWVLGVYQGVRSSHHMIANVHADLEGDTALVESYFQKHIRVEKPIGREDVFLGGRNLDHFERRPAGPAGAWKIVHRKEILDWARTEAASDIFYHQNPDAHWSQRAKADASYHMSQFPGTQGKAPSFLGRHYDSKSIKF
ncbi:MAG: nuclear transport factor 2 family protein [Alphaproteobacteria bacterium]|nr:nuclear transport factor 2 family protein [Alphaproteobacteria bacterium]